MSSLQEIERNIEFEFVRATENAALPLRSVKREAKSRVFFCPNFRKASRLVVVAAVSPPPRKPPTVRTHGRYRKPLTVRTRPFQHISTVGIRSLKTTNIS